MQNGPWQSLLTPHYSLIYQLRAKRPPMPYSRIAALLAEEHGIKVHRNTIQSFVRARSRQRKFYTLPPPPDSETQAQVAGKMNYRQAEPAGWKATVIRPKAQISPSDKQQHKTKFVMGDDITK